MSQNKQTKGKQSLPSGDAETEPGRTSLGLHALLETGRLSDFTLVSHGKEFHLHRSVVLSQSPVMAAALNGPFKESITNKLLVDDSFTLENVERMVSFLYTGKYHMVRPVDDGMTPKRAITSSTDATQPNASFGCLPSFKAPNADDEDELTDDEEESEDEPTVYEGDDVSTADDLYFYLLANLSLSQIARYYNIETLERLQLTKMTKLICRKGWPPHLFVEMVMEVLDTSDDPDLINLLTKAIVNHHRQLADAGAFSMLEKHVTFHVLDAVLTASGPKMRKYEKIVAHVRKKLGEATR